VPSFSSQPQLCFVIQFSVEKQLFQPISSQQLTFVGLGSLTLGQRLLFPFAPWQAFLGRIWHP